LFSSDVSRSIIKAAERAKKLQFELSHKTRKPADTQNEHYNIVSGQSTSLMTLAHLILKVVGEGEEEKGQVQQGGRVIATQSDPMFTDAYSALPDKAKKVLGFVAATPLEEGLRVYIKGTRGTDKETLKEKAKKKGCFNSTLLSLSEEEEGVTISPPLGSGDKRPRYPSVNCRDYTKAIQRLEENKDEKERTEEKASTSPLPACSNDCDLLIRCVNSGSCLCVDDRCPSRFKGFMDSLELSMLGYLSPSSSSSSSSSVELEKEMNKVSNKEVIILGSGPTSLCAGKRLEELGHKKWRLFPNAIVGTNSKEEVGQPLEIERLFSSVKWTDNEGFTWDLGARHPFLSRFKWFDNLLDLILPSTEWIQHYAREEEPSSFVFLKNDLISQPIFYGLDQLSTKESTASCLSDIIGERFKQQQQRQNKERGGTQEEFTFAEGEGIEEAESKDTEKSLEEWAISNYGRCLADSFVLPQLKKEWPNAEVFSSSSQQEGQKIGRPILGTSWLDESVSVDLKKVSLSALTGRSTAVLSNSLTSNQEQNGFGEQSFRYPLKGSQDFWNKVKAHLPSHQIQSQPVQLNTILLQQKKTGREKNLVKTGDGSQFTFDSLISSLSLDKVLGIVKESSPSSFPYSYYSSLLGKNKQTILFVGIGVKGNFPPKFFQARWIDFPESVYPFYRLTLLSNISPHLVPLTNSFSVLAEISLSTEDSADSQFETKKVELIKATVIALNKCGLIRTDSQILSTFSHVSKHARPIPFLHRDQKLRVLDKNLKKNGIWSRGGFVQ
jgi:protoporphyrinogen oxidase